MNYQLFRLSLMKNGLPPLLEYIQEGRLLVPTRAEFLLGVFSRRWDFLHWGKQFSFVDITILDSVAVGRVGRLKNERVSDTPDNKFAPIEKQEFQAVNVLIDMVGDTDGQKVAIQSEDIVGKPFAILASLILHINDSLPDAPYQMGVHPITIEEDFWAVVDKHRAEITSVIFRLEAPNVLGLGSNVSQEMAKARDQNNASEATVALTNKKGIRLDTQDIRDTVQYTSRGGGDAILKAKRRILFDSRKRSCKVNTEVDVAASDERRDLLRMMIRAIFGK